MLEKIYDVNTHSINFINFNCKNFSLTIGFAELTFELDTKKMLDISGFLPLIKAKKLDINVPHYEEGDYFLPVGEKFKPVEGEIYKYNDKILNGTLSDEICFDKNKRIISIGNINSDTSDKAIRINKNIICVTNRFNELKTLYIKLDKIEG